MANGSISWLRRSLLAAVLGAAVPAAAGADSLAAAGRAVFPAGARFEGAPLTDLSLGAGISLEPDGAAEGTLALRLWIATPVGGETSVGIAMDVTSATVHADGRTTVVGTAEIEGGEGLLPLGPVPLRATLGGATIALEIAGTSLEPATLIAGGVALGSD